MFIGHPPLWLRPQKRKPAVLKRHNERDENKLRKRELTPSLPSRLGELESIAVTHGAEEDHRQRHQSQLHSPCCLLGHAGSPPVTGWNRCVCVWRPSSPGQVNTSAAGKDDPSSFLWHCSLCLSLPSPLLFFSVSFTLVVAVSASLWSGGWCCGCKSKQARGTTSHHAGGSSGKGSRRSGVVAWKGGLRGCVEDEEEERMERRSKFWWFNPWSLGWAGRQAMNPLFKVGLLSVSACLHKHVSY